ncbi:hypothetical protein VitviT2T_018913 [Vitis vinifera]|uniref:Uncharacterized protein n=1 Tax=Vitis vinifera TaxID=29760 RepID=A0ABY9D1C2_VITVI|nr:hypothetical protein VitviT2T_018913 [Vitis vinifera]
MTDNLGVCARHCSIVRIGPRAITVAPPTRGANVIGIPRCREPPSQVTWRHCSTVRLEARAITVTRATVNWKPERSGATISAPYASGACDHYSNVRLGTRVITVASSTRVATVIGILRGREPPSRVTWRHYSNQLTSREAYETVANVRLGTRAITVASATRVASVIGILICSEPQSRVSCRHCGTVRLGSCAITIARAIVIGILRGQEPTSRVTWRHCSNVRLGTRAITVASATRVATVIGILRGQEPQSRVSGFGFRV